MCIKVTRNPFRGVLYVPPVSWHIPISIEAYLEGELKSEMRHEYIDGRVYAMVGSNDRHGLILNALAFVLTPASRKKGCQLFTSDMKLRLEIAGKPIFYYPNLLLRRIDKKVPRLRRIFVCLQGAHSQLRNPLRNTAGGRKDKQDGNISKRSTAVSRIMLSARAYEFLNSVVNSPEYSDSRRADANARPSR
jgi:hypothetical protein